MNRIASLIAEWRKPLRGHLKNCDPDTVQKIVKAAVEQRDKEIIDETTGSERSDFWESAKTSACQELGYPNDIDETKLDDTASERFGDVQLKYYDRLIEEYIKQQMLKDAFGGKDPVHLGDGLISDVHRLDYVFLKDRAEEIESVDPGILSELPLKGKLNPLPQLHPIFERLNKMIDAIENGEHTQDPDFAAHMKSAYLILVALESGYLDYWEKFDLVLKDPDRVEELAEERSPERQYLSDDQLDHLADEMQGIESDPPPPPFVNVSPEQIAEAKEYASNQCKHYAVRAEMVGKAKQIIGKLVKELGISLRDKDDFGPPTL